MEVPNSIYRVDINNIIIVEFVLIHAVFEHRSNTCSVYTEVERVETSF